MKIGAVKFTLKGIKEFISALSTFGPGYLSRYSDSLRAGRSGDRIPVGARLSAPVHTYPGPTQPPIQWVPGLSPG